MNDTPYDVRKKQNEIWMGKPLEERMRLGLELIEAVNAQIEDRIRRQHPAYSEGEIRTEFIRQMYKDELSTEYLKLVTDWVLEKYRSQE